MILWPVVRCRLTQCVVSFRGVPFASANQKHYSDLVVNISMGFVQAFPRRHFPRKPVGGVAKCQLFSQATRRCVNKLLILPPLRVYKTLSQYSYPCRYPLGLCAKKYKTALDVNILKEKIYLYSKSVYIDLNYR